MEVEMMGLNDGVGSLSVFPTDAEKLAKETIATKTALLGAEHPATLDSMNKLVLICLKRNQVPEALELGTHVVTVGRRILRADDINLLGSIVQLSDALRQSQRYEEALILCNEVLGITSNDKMGGTRYVRHFAMWQAATIEERSGKNPGRAIRLYEEVLASSKFKTSESRYDDWTAGVLISLSKLYDLMGKNEEAARGEGKVLEINRRLYGMGHEWTWHSMARLANYYSHCNQFTESVKILTELIEIKRRILGAEHADTLAVVDSLVHALCLMEEAGGNH